MFDITQRKYIYKPTVKDLISILEGENLDAVVTIDGLDEFYIHCTEDGHHLGIDVDNLDYEYCEYYDNVEDYNSTEPFKIEYEISRVECLDLLSKVVNSVSEPFLLSHGFTKEQIKIIKGE